MATRTFYSSSIFFRVLTQGRILSLWNPSKVVQKKDIGVTTKFDTEFLRR